MAYTTIDDPSPYFQIALYTGNGNSGKNISLDSPNFPGEYVGQDLQPDWVWIKKRSGGTVRSHGLYDSSRGATKLLHTDGTNAEQTQSQGLTAFGSNDFTLGTDDGVNGADHPYVAWLWNANNGTTASNSDGSITSTVQANTTAGFSIVTYTGNGSSGATIGHGLGAVPSMFIIKRRSGTEDWVVYHHKNTSAPETDHLLLNTTDATSDSDTRFNDTAPTSSLITMGNNAVINASGSTYVGYCFAEKQGYSKFGSYTGNGNADGTFIYTGFKPAWVMTKETGATGAWYMHDTKRDPSNGATHQLIANTNEVEYDTGSDVNIDILSNGFKQRYAGGSQNGNGDTHIYMAFAESPFVSSEGVPTTAR